MTLKNLTQELLKKRGEIRKMGGEEELAKQKAQGKLNVRERVELLFDKGTFTEIGILGTYQSDDPLLKGRPTPADGAVTGFGLVNGRKVCVIAYDFTVLAGTIGEVNERKAQRLRDLAFHERVPLVWLLDSAGARVQEVASSRFAETGKMFYDQILYSGVVPQVAAVMGPCAAGTAYIPALADFIPMVKGTSSMALAGPPLVKAAIGEEISVEDLGGSRVHCEMSGVADVECADDKACIETIKKYLGYFPAHSGEKPPYAAAKTAGKISESERMARLMAGETIDENRIGDEILDMLPEKSNQPYDMRKIVEKLVDGGEYLELKPKFGQALITAFARIGGYSVGIIASQPMHMGGVLNIDESDKAARFINLCDSYNIPLVFLQDLPGFMVGSEVEKKGIIRHGAKMLHAMARASVPKLTVIVRKAYGAGYYALCGKAFGPDLVVAWPTAEISLMGAEGAVNIVFRKEIEKSADPKKRRDELIEMFRKKIALEIAAGGVYIDDVIDPRDTRKVLIGALQLTENKAFELPKKKLGVMPV
jgi:acetyl-CoA carboxylase carboxyltransferase component